MRNKVWILIDRPNDYPIIRTKWMFRNKLDENRIIVRNKARLIAKGNNQKEDISFGKTFAPVARLEAIRLLLVFAYFMKFKLYQIDIKSIFLRS